MSDRIWRNGNEYKKCPAGHLMKVHSKVCTKCGTIDAAPLATPPTPVEDQLRVENTELRAELSRNRSLITAFRSKDLVENRIVRAVQEMVERNPYRPQLQPPPSTPRGPKDHEMLISISDAHFPEVVEPEAAFGICYNGDICRRRIEYLRDKIIRYRDLRSSAYSVRKLTIAVLGDMLSGDIHEELEVTNEGPMSESLTRMAYMLFDFGLACAEAFPEIEMIFMPGNHPRIQKKPRYKQKWNNWEYVLGMFVQALARDKFEVKVPKDIVYRHQVFEHQVGLSHGDGIKSSSFAGIPWYRMRERRDALQSLLRMASELQLDLLIYGHFHQLIFEEGQGCSLLINGSIKGGDEFSIGTRYAAQSPVQALLTFHPKHGITDISRINLGHIV